MRKYIPAIGAFVASGLLAGAALADGLAERYSLKDTPIITGPQWSGFYIGAGAGYGQAVLDNVYHESTGFSQVLEGDGARGGFATAILGFDRQIGERFVVGAFVDFDWSSIELRFSDSFTPEQKLRLEWMWAVGGRAGYLLTQSTLLYVAAGFTQAEFKNKGFNDIFNSGTLFVGKSTITHDGFFVAFGMEAMLGQGLALRGELRYSEFDEQITNRGNLFGVDFDDRQEPTVLTGRLVLTYKFGGDRDRGDSEPLK